MRKIFWVGRFALLVVLVCLWTGCGDQFRPVAVPEPTPPPNPGSLHFALVISDNGLSSQGSSTRIDVSGDSNVGVQQTGFQPVHAAVLPNGGRVYIANAGENSVTSFALGSVLSPATTSLPANSVPVFVTAADNNTVYVASVATPGAPLGSTCLPGCVNVIPVVNNVVTDTLIVGNNVTALAETPNALNIYAVNNADNTVTSINGANQTVRNTIAVGTSPVWAVARSDNNRVYVLNSGDGTISTIDSSLSPTQDLVLSAISVGVGANYMAYDPRRNRVYVTNPVADTLTTVDVSNDPPAVLATTCVVSGAAPPNCPATLVPDQVAVTPDGSRAYVASYQLLPSACTAGQVCTITAQVTAINAISNVISAVIPLGTFAVDTVNDTGCNPATSASPARFRVSTATSGDGSRDYVAVCDAGATFIVRTLDNTLITGSDGSTPLALPAPSSVFTPPTPVNGVCPNQAQQPPAGQPCNPPLQNPVLIVSGP